MVGKDEVLNVVDEEIVDVIDVVAMDEEMVDGDVDEVLIEVVRGEVDEVLLELDEFKLEEGAVEEEEPPGGLKTVGGRASRLVRNRIGISEWCVASMRRGQERGERCEIRNFRKMPLPTAGGVRD
jgi:hypothetical protein